MSLLLIQAVMYYVQSREEMFDSMRFWVILTNLSTLTWFIALQYYRFKTSGRACSGDFMMPGTLGVANPWEDHPAEE